MDEDSTFIRVKLTFGAQSKQAKLDKAIDTSLSSMKNLRKLIFKHFPEIEEMVDRPPRTIGAFSPSHLLLVQCKGHNVGDYTLLEGEEELAAMELLQYSSVDFYIEVIPIPTSATQIPSNRLPKGSSSRQSDRADVGLYRKTGQCKNFQFGFCRHGEGCRFAHDPARLTSHNWSHSHTETMDSAIVDVQEPARRGSRSQDRLSSLLGLPNLQARNPNQLHFAALREKADYSCWVHQASLSSAMNIEYLSGDNHGYPMLSTLVNQTNIPHKTIVVFVKLLAREEIRTSLLRQYTDKIYGVLTGSPFLLQLNDHIQFHLGMIPNLVPQDVRPYLTLMEELLSRTMEGWKVPLTALKIVVSKLNESTAKNDLKAIVSRLDDRCARVQRLLPVFKTEQQHFQGEDFRNIAVMPLKEELEGFQVQQKLPVIGTGIQYSRVSSYLETHFRLLRADCIDPLRHSVNSYRSIHKNTNANCKASMLQNLRIYRGLQLVGIQCGFEGVDLVVSFHVSASERTPKFWESSKPASKKLMSGALLCISSDHFQTCFLGVVAHRDSKELANGRVSIRIIGDRVVKFVEEFKKGLASTEAYAMLESTGSYFGAYHHVLKTLQRQEMENIPFTPYLLHLEPSVSPPSYLQQREGGDEYDFSCAFPDIHEKLGKTCIRIMQSDWPSDWTDSLDRAQQDALRQGLTKELAIIQGPPGTGKTFLGLLLVKIFVANLKQSPDHAWGTRNEAFDSTGPILVLCHSNRALDQFLEGLFRNGERKLIRVGGAGRQGKSEMLIKNNLYSLLKQLKTDRKVDSSHQRLYAGGIRDKDRLQSKIHKCIDAFRVKLATHSMLNGIATREQRQSLFWIEEASNKSSTKTKIVKLWLTETDPHLAQQALATDRDDDAAEDFHEWASMKLLPKSEAHDVRKWMEVQSPGRPGEDTDGRNCQTRVEGHVQDHNPHQTATNSADGDLIEEAVRLAPDVWQLALPQRMILHEHWLEQKRKLHREELRMLTAEYEEACKRLKEVQDEVHLSILRKANVVGMTTTSAARHYDVLKSLQPRIVIVDEASEVLEGHILASLSPSVQHLILIGDHLQVRPKVAVDELAIKNKLDLSMFERLVGSGVEHVSLKEQRRMNPSISKLVRSLYPGLRDHESVGQYEDVTGMKSNVFFFDHKAEEDPDSGNNSTEANLIVELCLYLLNQGYKPENIAILAMYTGQSEEITSLLEPRIHSRYIAKTTGARPCENPGAEELNLLSRISSVDEGEESDIVILSLATSSNSIVTKEDGGKVGFFNMPNKICVALTRARKGLYIFGNADLLADESTLWKDVTTKMRNSGELGSQLELCCQNHPDIITKITSAEDFEQVQDGGCSLPCGLQLACGHVCPRSCHPESHDLILCGKPCLRQHDDCYHCCTFRCHGSKDCPPCTVLVMKKMPHCEHEQGVECSNDLTNTVWRRRSQPGVQCMRCLEQCS